MCSSAVLLLAVCLGPLAEAHSPFVFRAAPMPKWIQADETWRAGVH
jgi:hypothetical protein